MRNKAVNKEKGVAQKNIGALVSSVTRSIMWLLVKFTTRHSAGRVMMGGEIGKGKKKVG